MKKYRLRQWYPSLPKEWKYKKGIVSFNTISNGYKMVGVEGVAWVIKENEFNNSDFWELIKEAKPLFVTEDGVKIYTDNVKLFGVNSTFITATDNEFDYDVCKKEGWKLFFYKSNADEYILYNKPLLSLVDIYETNEMYSHKFVELIKLAKERVKQ